jgi:hypothetical protein
MTTRSLLRGLLGVLLVGASGCTGSRGSSSAVDAVVNVALAAGSSALSRSSGDCYASCPTGTMCNKETGFCERLPCRGECRSNEECVEQALTYRCVVLAPPGGNITVEPKAKSEP